MVLKVNVIKYFDNQNGYEVKSEHLPNFWVGYHTSSLKEHKSNPIRGFIGAKKQGLHCLKTPPSSGRNMTLEAVNLKVHL